MIVALFAAVFAAIAEPAAAQRGGYIVVDAESGRVLRERRPDKRLHPASLTKMMTLYLVFEALESGRLKPDQKIRISRRAARTPPVRIGLREGERIRLRTLLRAAAIRSANDAAVALAEAVAGSEARFAERMTAKAKALGMTRTRFRNATGFTKKGHLSTPRDMAILTRRLWRDFPDYYHIFGRTSVRARGRRFRATNTLLGAAPGVDGVKTGYTRAAGHNLAASARRRGARIIVVFLGGKSRGVRDREVERLLDDGFRRLADKRKSWPPLQRASAPAAAPTPTPRPRRAQPEMRIAAAPTPRPARPGRYRPAFLSPALISPGLLGPLKRAQPAAPAPPSALELPPAPRPAAVGEPPRKRPTATSSTPPPGPPPEPIAAASTTAAAASSPDLTTGDAARAAKPLGRWAVQIMAAETRAEAERAWLRLAHLRADAPGSPLAAGRLAITEAAVAPRGAKAKRVYFRLRVSGLDKAGARKACKALKRSAFDCALVPPRGW